MLTRSMPVAVMTRCTRAASGAANPDVVRTGPGIDQVVMVPPSGEGVLDAGRGGDIASFDLTTPAPTDWQSDIANRTIAQGGLTGNWSGTIESLGFVADQRCRDAGRRPSRSPVRVMPTG